MVATVTSKLRPAFVPTLQCRSGERCRYRGFTLIELLVVIGIIGLLIAILLPTLSRAKDQGNTIKCLSNLRSIGAAFTQYVTAHNGALPYADADMAWKPWSAQFFGTGTPSQPWHYNNVHRHLMKYLGGRYNADNHTIITLDSEIFRCPNAVDFPAPANKPSRFNDTNYTFNGVMLRRKANNFKRSAQFITASEGRYSWNVSAMRPYPAVGTGLLNANLDNVEYRQWMWIESGLTAGNNKVLNLTLHRRGVAGNVLYLDGHAATVDYRDVRPTDFGLTDSAIPGQGRATDTYVELAANPTASYRAGIR